MRSEILGKLRYRGEKKLLVKNQNVDDIINEILIHHNEYKTDYDKICKYFVRANEEKTLKAIFDFLKNNVKYKIETGENQKIKSPGAIVYTGKTTGSDCKSYASFICGAIDAINRSGFMHIPFAYRFASYQLFDSNPQHVFAVAYPGTKNEIWIDPVLPEFDQRKDYIFKIDKKPMPLYSISGIGATREQRQAKRLSRREGENCTGRRIPKFAPPLIIGRRAFLYLIRLNARKLGTKMVLGMRVPEIRAKILKKWCSMGGNAKTLKKVIAKEEAKLIRKRKILSGFDMPGLIGLDPATLTAAYASAAPYLAAMTPILALVKKFLPPGSQAAQILEEAEDVSETVQESADQMSGCGCGCGTGCGCENKISGSFVTGPLPIILLSAAGLYLILKK